MMVMILTTKPAALVVLMKTVVFCIFVMKMIKTRTIVIMEKY